MLPILIILDNGATGYGIMERTYVTAYAHLWQILSFLGLSLKVFKTDLLERGFHIFIKNARSPPQLMWDFTTYNLKEMR